MVEIPTRMIEVSTGVVEIATRVIEVPTGVVEIPTRMIEVSTGVVEGSSRRELDCGLDHALLLVPSLAGVPGRRPHATVGM